MAIARAGDGELLTYRVHGPTTGERAPLLTVHGLVSSTQHWKYFTPHFAAVRPVVAWEFRGHAGQPPPKDKRGGVAQFADDAYAVWRASGQPPAVIAGLSFGVQVALELWRRHPDCVRALVLICGTAGSPFAHVGGAEAVRRGLAAMIRTAGKQPVLARPLLALLRSAPGRRIASELAYVSGGAMRDACPRDVLDDLFGHVGALDPHLLTEIVASYLEHDAFDVLPTIAVPALIVAADRDQLTPVATAERMRAAIPNAELVVFTGHGHLVQVEDPTGVHAVIDRFLARHRL